MNKEILNLCINVIKNEGINDSTILCENVNCSECPFSSKQNGMVWDCLDLTEKDNIKLSTNYINKYYEI